jgi:hypothetical protein
MLAKLNRMDGKKEMQGTVLWDGQSIHARRAVLLMEGTSLFNLVLCMYMAQKCACTA